MKVKATNQYKLLNLKDKELERVPEEGEIFEISEERYKYLTRENKYNIAFVEKVEESKEIETAVKKTKKEKSVKKVTKK